MQYIKKQIAEWELKIGQIGLSGKDNILAREIFKNYFGRTFTLKTFKGEFNEINFNEKSLSTSLRLACSSFFKKLSPGHTFFLYPGGINTVIISETEPKSESEKEDNSKLSNTELLNLVSVLSKENVQLRETNSNLFQYKERVERFNNLNRIFDDEKFMEDWLERNIHKAVADLEIIERQPSVVWPNSKLKNRMDFFCLDKTTRELVIVENKVRGNTKTIETQYLSYQAWIKENIDDINKKYADRNLKATLNFKFVIITDTSDERLESICRHTNIALILIDGGVIFDELVPYNAD
jgi:hypothetical protein